MNEPKQLNAKQSPRWMSVVLILAAIYNIVWGIWVILRPNDMFDFANIPRPLYPAIWQCVGMIVGVYGVGYACAARDPLRHWPVTLVGFLGKLFGPIGILYGWLTLTSESPGYLPLRFSVTSLTNDVIWWLPFAAILYAAFKHHNGPSSTNVMSVQAANQQFKSQLGNTIAELSRQQNVLVVLLRHSGCTFCREALADLSQQRAQIESVGTKIVIVHMSDNESTQEYFVHYGVEDLDRISDPECVLYRAYELGRGRLSQLFGPGVWWRGFKSAILNRHGVGKLDGDGFQMPGTFLVRDNQIQKAYRHATAASRPDYCELAGC